MSENNLNEPTTGEIVRALREVVSDPMFRIHEIAKRCRVAADRLESQERSIGEAAKLNEKQAHTIAEITARAESAEETMKAILEVIYSGSVICSICSNRVGWDTCKQCEFKWNRPHHQDKK